MVIDDCSMELEILGELLDLQGYQPILLQSGHSVVEIAKEIKPFCILLDIHMPEKSGLDVFKELRNNEDTKDIPVVFITGDNELENKCLELTSDKDLFFSKPVRWEILSIIIKEKEKGSIAKEEVQKIQNQLKDVIDKLLSV